MLLSISLLGDHTRRSSYSDRAAPAHLASRILSDSQADIHLQDGTSKGSQYKLRPSEGGLGSKAPNQELQ